MMCSTTPNLKPRGWLSGAVLALSFLVAAHGDPGPLAALDNPVVVARVDDQPIYAGELASALAGVPQVKRLAPADLAAAQATMLNQLIDRLLVLTYLTQHDQTVSTHLVDAELKERKALLKKRKIAWNDYLRSRGLTEAVVRRDINWRHSWKKYIDRRVTDDVLQAHFDKHRKEFDGTRVRVAHILLAADSKADPQAIAALKSRADALRTKIVDGQIEFADAVAKYSTAASRGRGGDLGFISRHGEMVESFNAAAFALAVNEISPPVVTPFGVHLIRCTDIRTGTKKWSDVTDQLRSAVIQRGFRRIADTQRKTATIEFTRASP